jgi:DNA polymerase III epsilon subunit-like protein
MTVHRPVTPEDYFQHDLVIDPEIIFRGLDSVVGFDLETTGLKPDIAQVTQIGAVHLSVPSMVMGTIFNHETQGKIRLTEENAAKLDRETHDTKYPGNNSMSWVLAYNGYHPYTKFLTDESGSVLMGRDFNGREYKIPHKLTDRQVSELVADYRCLSSEENGLTDFIKWTSEQGVHTVVGHNIINFDIPFMNYRRALYGMPAISFNTIDVMWFARGVFLPVLKILSLHGNTFAARMASNLKPRKEGEPLKSSLQDIRNCGFDVKTAGLAHHAIGDVETTAGVLVAMVNFIKEVKPLLDNNALMSSLQEYRSSLHDKFAAKEWGY